jgi:hypothetical protein
VIFVDGNGLMHKVSSPPRFLFPYVSLPVDDDGPVVMMAMWRPSSLTAVDEEAAAYLRDVSAQYVAYVVANHL